MDDFYIIHSDKLLLRQILKEIEAYIKPLGLRLNGKTQILPLKNGIDFLGFHTYLTQTGKVVRKVRAKSIDNMKRELDGPHLTRQHLPPAAEHGRLFLQLFPGAQTITERRHNSWPKN